MDDKLNGLILLYDLAITLDITKLQQAIAEHIAAACDGVHPSVFISFAAECYKEGKDGHKVTPECLLGKLIEAFLA